MSVIPIIAYSNAVVVLIRIVCMARVVTVVFVLSGCAG